MLVREAGPWTILKLTFLREYLQAYVTATKSMRRHGNVCYMDLFAGPGKDRDRETGDEVAGSPSIAMGLFPGFQTFIFVDLEEKNITQLREDAVRRGIANVTHTIVGDCNQAIDEALKSVPMDGATFCFVDPEGPHAYWSTISAISQHKPEGRNKVELMILFPYDMQESLSQIDLIPPQGPDTVCGGRPLERFPSR